MSLQGKLTTKTLQVNIFAVNNYGVEELLVSCFINSVSLSGDEIEVFLSVIRVLDFFFSEHAIA